MATKTTLLAAEHVHVNNFDFLRLLFATSVLYTHSYPLTSRENSLDILGRFSHGQSQLSTVGVAGFFVLSGYLVLHSLLRSRNLADYFFKRIIRIFPALWVVVATCMVGGYFLAHKPAADYFTQPSFYKYALMAVLRIHLAIAGVFESNPYPRIINGSLWTVPYEFLFYILLSALFWVKHNTLTIKILLVIIVVALLLLRLVWHGQLFLPLLAMSADQLLTFAVLFGSGAILALFRLPSERTRLLVAAAGVSGLGLTLWLGGYSEAQFILLPPVVVYFGTLSFKAFRWVRRMGDISYGVYIWSFPIQQTLWYFLHPSQVTMCLLSMPLTYGVAFISWHFIEKPTLRLKQHSTTQHQPIEAG